MTLKQLDAICWGPQESCVGFTPPPSALGYPKSFSTTAASPEHYLTASTLAAYGSGNADFAGMVVEVVRAANGPTGEKGAKKRAEILGYTHSTKRLTINALDWSSAAGDSFNLLWPPHSFFCEDTGGSQRTVRDATRDEATDFWVGAAEQGGSYVRGRKTSAISSTVQALVSNFSSLGRLSCASLAASTVIGDLFEAAWWPETSSPPIPANQPRVDRKPITGRAGIQQGVAGLREGGGPIELFYRGPGRTRICLAPECDIPFGAVFDITAGDSALGAVGVGSSVSNVVAACGGTIDGMYLISDRDVVVCTATSASAIAASPSMRTAAKSGELVRLMRTYRPSEGLNYAMFIRQWFGKEVEQLLVGCVPKIKIAFKRGDYIRITCEFQVADWVGTDKGHTNADISRPVSAKLSTVVPRATNDIRINLGGVEIEPREGELDLGCDVQPHENLSAPNGTDGFQLVDTNPTGMLDLWLDGDSKEVY
ncbi:MAG: hypothetical protein M0R22_13845, partial [Dehalococcoidia bacterium]|nr:hypothetical protein [Dehalococcoidia bacterium]